MRIGIDCRKAADYGIGTYIRGLLGGLASLEGDEQYVLFAPSKLFHLLPSNPRFLGVPELSAPYSIHELFTLRRAIADHRLDLFHAPHYVIPFTRTPVVVTIHDLIHLKLPMWRRHPLAPLYARWMMGRAVRNSARILTGSQAVRTDLEKRYPFARDKVVVTQFAIDTIFSAVTSASPERLARYGLTARRYLLFVGNDKPHKNLDRLVAAYRLVRDKHPEIALVLAGGTSRFGIEPGVVSAGFVPAEDLPHLYRGALALVQPSLEEGFGMPVLEAMASGAPVVASRHAALAELAGEAALFIDPNSIGSIASGLIEIIEDDSLRRQLSESGRARADRFSWRMCAESTRQVYRAAAMEQRR